ncbi:Uma2 family endonuclease [Chloroflexi bacterium TSY]|nr:Uma2 family endonuclease [Chloroflexi bacterium TSY]
MSVTIKQTIETQADHLSQNGRYNTKRDDPYPYGWRTVVETNAEGNEEIRWIPLTQENFLDPQLGDQMVQSDAHFKIVNSLYDRFEKHYLFAPNVGIFSDVKMLWGIPGLQEPAPDLAIVVGLRDKEKERTSFDVVEEGALPCLIVEVVSPNYPGDEDRKVTIYRQAGVTEYIILNPHLEDRTLDYELTGYRLTRGRYRPIRPNARGQLLSRTTNVLFRIGRDGRKLILTNATTHKELLDNEGEHRALLKEQNARREEERKRREEERKRIAAEERAQAAEQELARLRKLKNSDQG